MSLKEQIKFDIEWGNECLVRTQQTVELQPIHVESWSVLLREGQSRHINETRLLNARRVAKELEIMTKVLNRNLPAIPPTLTKEEIQQISQEWGNECLVRTHQTVKLRPYDVESWSVLLRESRHMNEVRSLYYESLLAVFPKIYIDQELEVQNFERVNKLFERFSVEAVS